MDYLPIKAVASTEMDRHRSSTGDLTDLTGEAPMVLHKFDSTLLQVFFLFLIGFIVILSMCECIMCKIGFSKTYMEMLS